MDSYFLMWSLDDSKILSEEYGEDMFHIWVIDVDSGNQRKVMEVSPFSSCGWAEGNVIVYAHKKEGGKPQFELWTVNSDGTGRRRLTDKVWYGELEIAPSPDGKFLALRGAFSESAADRENYGVQILRLSDGKINDYDMDSILFNPNTHVEFLLFWSPDGKKLVYELKENRFYVAEIDLETLEIVEERGVLGREEAIKYLGGDAVTDKSFGEYFIYPQWSPVDNRALVVNVGEEVGDSEIWMLDLDSGEMEKLIDHASAPRWSPDGKKFSFLRHDEERIRGTVWIAAFED